VDIREQFPANPKLTSHLANELGIKHPSMNGVEQVITTDFIIDVNLSGKYQKYAISVKYANELDDSRTIEKQEIERRYWESKSIKWFIITEKEIPKILVRNIKWLTPHFYSFDLDETEKMLIFDQFKYAIDTYPVNKITHISASLDQAYTLKTWAILLSILTPFPGLEVLGLPRFFSPAFLFLTLPQFS